MRKGSMLMASGSPLRARTKGQAIVLIALCMLVLMAMVGLAVDGGSMLNQRREAQNAVDGAALNGVRVMLPYFQQMITDNPDGDVDGSAAVEGVIRSAVEQYAAQNGVITSTMQIYFVDDYKQIVTVNVGLDKGKGNCGIGQPGGLCEVGQNGLVPWTIGAKGIYAKGTAETDTFFMKLLGWDKAGAAASATAFIGVGAMADNVSLVPLGLYGTSGGAAGGIDIDQIKIGGHYVLIDSTLDTGSGNWGWVDYNGQGTSATTVRAWLTCGFNPSVTQSQWETSWCPKYSNAPGWGPTRHYVSMSPPADWVPGPDPSNPSPVYPYYLKYGLKENGWWLRGSSGAVNSNCQDFKDRADASGSTGIEVLFPFFDRIIPAGGTDSYYHVRVVFAFQVKEGYVTCKPTAAPTPTVCPVGVTCPPPPTPIPGGGKTKWHIEGDATRIFSSAASGRHGDIRRTSVPVIFLDR